MQHALSLVLATLLGSGCTTASAGQQAPTPVEVWRGGDDGLTSRLVDEVTAQLRASTAFQVAEVAGTGKILITVDQATASGTEGRVVVRYNATFGTPAGASMGSAKGSCLETDLPDCAKGIISRAERARSKLPGH